MFELKLNLAKFNLSSNLTLSEYGLSSNLVLNFLVNTAAEFMDPIDFMDFVHMH